MDTTYTNKNLVAAMEICDEGVRFLHDDDLLSQFSGDVSIERATHVEFDQNTRTWYVQDAATEEIVASGFNSRTEALTWEKNAYQPGSTLWEKLVNNIDAKTPIRSIVPTGDRRAST